MSGRVVVIAFLLSLPAIASRGHDSGNSRVAPQAGRERATQQTIRDGNSTVIKRSLDGMFVFSLSDDRNASGVELPGSTIDVTLTDFTVLEKAGAHMLVSYVSGQVDAAVKACKDNGLTVKPQAGLPEAQILVCSFDPEKLEFRNLENLMANKFIRYFEPPRRRDIGKPSGDEADRNGASDVVPLLRRPRAPLFQTP